MAKRRGQEGSLSSYFRGVFTEKPEWLKAKRNNETVARYRLDHGIGEDAALPKNIMATLGNVKSVMRKQARKRGRPKGQPQAPRVPRNLDQLEIMIDEAMMLARSIDREGLDNVWRHLRTARNQVVLKMG